jgi:serine/threonine protein kinase
LRAGHRHALPAGHELGQYRVLEVLGVGGFGITYLAEHRALDRKVALKEYLPNEFAVREAATVHPKSEADRGDFDWGLRRFLDEARILARFEHRNVVRVRDYFEANSTAYIAMEYEDGESLDGLLAGKRTLDESQLKRVVLPILDGLRQVHAAGVLHRTSSRRTSSCAVWTSRRCCWTSARRGRRSGAGRRA